MSRIGLCLALALGFASTVRAQDLPAVEQNHLPAAEHADQGALNALVSAGLHEEAFVTAFELGDELFEAHHNVLDGVGANLGNGQRFTRMPRADLAGWAVQFPPRATGPNAQNCTSCHNKPFDDGAGETSSNVHRDPLHSGSPASMIQRNTPHLFGSGGLQRLAEEMTAELHAIRAAALAEAEDEGHPVTVSLEAKGISFGRLRAFADGSLNTSRIEGIAEDLVVRAFQWKGSRPTLRDFNRDASHNEIGMQPVELVGHGVDGDGDGVADEFTVGDMTAMAVYVAGQPRPVTGRELAALGLTPPIPAGDLNAIRRGERGFAQIGCAECHRPSLTLEDPIFSEPSQSPVFRDAPFPSGLDPLTEGVDPDLAITFDLTRDHLDNVVTDAAGNVVARLGSFETDGAGRALVRLFGDLKRHEMGPGLAESIDEIGTGASVFLTENLWGVGDTAPYLHDGRATTLTEAIWWHGGEAQAARNAFFALSAARQADVLAFLDDLKLLLLP